MECLNAKQLIIKIIMEYRNKSVLHTMKTLLFLIATLSFYYTQAQEYKVIIRNGDTTEVYDPAKGNNETYTFVEQMPQPLYDLTHYFSNNLKYPLDKSGKKRNISIPVKFIIRKDGSIDSAHIFKKIDPAFDKEAIRVVNNMPDWKPGTQNGKPVDVFYTVIVPFKSE